MALAPTTATALLAEARQALGRPAPTGDDLALTGPAATLPSRLAVTEAATAAVTAALLGAAELWATRNRTRAPAVAVDTREVAVAVTSERLVRVAGEPQPAVFDPLSRFWACANGWVRTHANYPWHRERLVGLLGGDPDPERVGSEIQRWQAIDLEEAIIDAGGCAAAVRSDDEWTASPQGSAISARPLVELRRVGDSPVRTLPADPQPAGGIRVLDFTKVIAGPVATRTLAAHGADVLRVDSPNLPELDFHRKDSLLGKRSTLLDLATPDGATQLRTLLAAADVVVCGYRPGGLERLGLDPTALADNHPGLVVLTLSAWGDGPWSQRRGFDSLVQAATGISLIEGQADGTPGALPAQVLDHATGYLAAAAILEGFRRRTTEGGTWHASLSLARTARWLLDQGISPYATGPLPQPDDYLVHVDSTDGPVTVARPPGKLGDQPLRWAPTLTTYGGDEPAWLEP